MTYAALPLVSEISTNGVVNCVPDSCIACVIASGKTGVPANNAEGNALRTAAGYNLTEPTAVEPIASAADYRYGISIKVVTTFAQLEAALTPGFSAFVIGKPIDCPYPGPFRRFFPYFAGLHCVAVANEGIAGQLWLVDPRGQAVDGYRGEPVTWSQLATFFVGSAGVLPLAEVDGMSVYEKLDTAGTFSVTAGATAHALKLDPAQGFVRTGASATSGSGTYDSILKRVVGTDAPTAVIHVATGLWAGFYINTGEVTEVAAPVKTYDQGVADGKAAAKAAAVKAVQAI